MVVGEVGRPAVYMRYSSGPRTLPWGTVALIGDSVVHRGSFDEKMSVVQIGLEKEEIIERSDCINLYKSPVCQTLSKA
jgi:hypothetical protein